MNFITTLTLNGVKDGSEIYWCASVLKQSGPQTSYDCGLCHHSFNRTLDSNTDPSEDARAEMKTRWNITDMYFNFPPFAKDPSIIDVLY